MLSTLPLSKGLTPKHSQRLSLSQTHQYPNIHKHRKPLRPCPAVVPLQMEEMPLQGEPMCSARLWIWPPVCAGDRKPEICCKMMPSCSCTACRFYASDSSPSSCTVPSSSDWSFSSTNFPSLVNGTDFISWANASGSWRQAQEFSRLQQEAQQPSQCFWLRFCNYFSFLRHP